MYHAVLEDYSESTTPVLSLKLSMNNFLLFSAISRLLL